MESLKIALLFYKQKGRCTDRPSSSDFTPSILLSITPVHPLPLFSTVKPKLVFLPEQPFNQNLPCLCYHSKVTHPVSSSYPVKVILQHRDLHGLHFQHVLGQRRMGARARTYECMWKSCIMDDSRLQLGEGGVAGAITRACPWAMDLSYESSPGGDGKQRK